MSEPIATDDLIALIAKSVAEEHQADNTVPGLVIAHIREDKLPVEYRGGGPMWYVCARRYDYDVTEKVMAKVYHRDLDEAVRLAAYEACNPSTEHQVELAKAVAALGLDEEG